MRTVVEESGEDGERNQDEDVQKIMIFPENRRKIRFSQHLCPDENGRTVYSY